MSAATVTEILEGPVHHRRHLSERQAETVAALVEAAVAEVEQAGYEGLTVRNVARRAGVAPATAYSYFSSKDHLLAEVLWRRVVSTPAASDPGAPIATRLADAIAGLGTISVDAPAVAAACTPALLSSNPDVAELRTRIGTEVYRRLAGALGDEGGPEIARILATTFFGAMLSASMGALDFDDIPKLVVDAALLMVRSGPERPKGGRP